MDRKKYPFRRSLPYFLCLGRSTIIPFTERLDLISGRDAIDSLGSTRFVLE